MSLLEQSLNPQFNTGGLTAGVDYFGRAGAEERRTMNAGPRSAATADFEVPDDTGFSQSDGASGFEPGAGGVGGRGVAGNIGLAGNAAGVVGVLSGNQDLADLGRDMSRGAGYLDVATNPNANNLGRLGLNELGVPAPVAGGVVGAYNNGIPGAIQGAVTGLAYSNPVTGLPAAAWDLAATLYGEIMDVPSSSRPTINNTIGQAVTAYQYDTDMFSDQTKALNEQDRGMRGWEASQTKGVSGVPNATAVNYGTNFNSPQSIALEQQDYDLTYDTDDMVGPRADPSVYGRDVSGGGGGDPGGDFGGTNGMAGDPSGAGAAGGTSYAADGGMATSNGFERPMPGITQRYNNGGMVSGAPTPGGGSLLTMGFADGGMVGMGGKPSPAMVQKRVDMILRDPQARQALLARPQQLMASGELTPEEVTTMARVAEASMFNPDLYPQLRQFVAEQGMTPLPASYDPLVVTRILAIAKALQEETPAGQVPGTDQAQMQQPVPGMKNGGYLQGPGTGRSDSIGTVNETTGQPVKVANGEYVVPAHVVRAKGREFFDNLLRRYSDVPKGE